MRNGLSSCAGVYGSRLLRSKGNMMFANRIWFYLSLGFIRCSLGIVLQTEENFTFIIWNWAVIQSPLLAPHPPHQRHCSKPVMRKVRTLNCKMGRWGRTLPWKKSDFRRINVWWAEQSGSWAKYQAIWIAKYALYILWDVHHISSNFAVTALKQRWYLLLG